MQAHMSLPLNRRKADCAFFGAISDSQTGHAATAAAARFRAVASRMRLRIRNDFGVASTYSSESMYSIARSKLILSGASN